jgi:PEP-CTERM motif
MNATKIALAALMTFGLSAAQATVVVNTAGPVTTYTENFNGGSSFSGGWFNAPATADDYLWLLGAAQSSSYSFSSAVALSALTLSFWYAVPDNGHGQVSVASSGLLGLPDAPGGVVAFTLANPGSSNAASAFFTTTLNNVAAGNYTVLFSTPNAPLRSMKVDDLQVMTTAVPEPESYALMLAGLAILAGVTRRRRA